MSMRKIRCANCGHKANAEYYITCPYCGFKLVKQQTPTTPDLTDPLCGMDDETFYKRLRGE